VQPLQFATTGLPPERQFDALRAAYATVLEMERPASADSGFPAIQRVWPLGRLVLVALALPEAAQPLRWAQAPGTTLDHWYVVQPCRLAGGKLLPPAGMRGAQFNSLAHPHAVSVEEEGVLLLFMPRGGVHETDAHARLDTRTDDGLLPLLGDMMLALANRLPSLDGRALHHAVDALAGVFEAVAAAREPVTVPVPAGNLTLVERARRLIRARLAEDELSPELVCRELGVSRSRLYRLFEPLGGISSYVRRQRLIQARHALADPQDRRPIMTIAEQWGFADPSVFSRSFRQEFGMSPRAVRESGSGRSGPAPARGGGDLPHEPASLAALLRALAV
jgi:AraC-like DNA-binding protein